MADAFPGTSPLPIPVPAPVPDPEPLPVTEPEHPRMEQGKTLHLAKWSTRFWAWLVDIILVILFLNIIGGILEPFNWKVHALWDFGHLGLFDFGIEVFIFFFVLDDLRELQGPVNREDGDEYPCREPGRHKDPLGNCRNREPGKSVHPGPFP